MKVKKKKLVLSLSLALGLSFSAFAFADSANAADMYRLYNKNSGEHFYTANSGEKNNLTKVGWKYEGIGWTAPSSGTPVYRLYNANAGDHHYTLNLAEKNNLVKVGWKYEGIGWYSDTKKAVPLYRAYNPNAKAGSHNYTVNYAEQQNLLRVGWKNEGISWYGIKKTTAPAPVTKYTVTIKHVGSDGKTLKSSTTKVDKGKSYTAKAESFSGYTLKGNNSQTVKVDGNKTITFNYTKNAVQKYNVTVVHKGTDGKELKKTTTAVESGKQYTAKAETFAGYTLNGSSSQTVTVNGAKTITFNYTKNPAPAIQKFKVTVVHKSVTGKVIETEKTIEVEKGKQHTAKAKTFDGYYPSSTATQTITVNADSTITFTYYPFSEGDKTKLKALYDKIKGTQKGNYTDASWTEFQKQLSLAKTVIDSNSATQSTIDLMIINLQKAYDNLELKAPEVQKFTVSIQYKEKNGKLLTATIDKVEVEKGKQYTATAKTFAGYTVEGSNTQTVTVNADTLITFNYTKNVVEEDLTAIANNVAGSSMIYINNYRKSSNSVLVNVETNSAIQSYAMVRAQEIATLYDHQRPSGAPVLSVPNYGNATGENIGRFQNVPLEWIKSNGAEQLVNAWINSVDHASYLKSKNVNEGGVGVYINKNSNGTYNLYFAYLGAENPNKPISGYAVRVTHKLNTGKQIGMKSLQVLEDIYTPEVMTRALIDGKVVDVEAIDVPTVDLRNSTSEVQITVTYKLK